jgi:hypothetical protein
VDNPLRPSEYVSTHYAALIAAGVAISLAMFLWDRRRKG